MRKRRGMRGFLGLFAAAAVALSAVPAAAMGGVAAGQYYATDIRTYLNGHEIDAINIGGETLISAEDMEYYSFSVRWVESERRLYIDRTAHETSGPPPAVVKPSVRTGTVLGDYYKTDIVTLLDGRPITSYNLGGRTYIHAEQMRDWGYTVDWNEADRTLSVVSPDRAGYLYSLALSEGSRPETDASESDGYGAFAISRENGKLTGCGDAARFDASLSCDGTKYTLGMVFYQYEGMFYAIKLLDLLEPLCCARYGEPLARPEERYAAVAENVNITINGHRAEKIAVERWGGNGHADYVFTVTDLPMIRESEIESVYFSVGDASGMEPYEILFSKNEHQELDEAIEGLKQYPEDFVQSVYYTKNYTAVYFCQSPSLGVIKHRLYILDNETKEFSADLLDQVRQLEGFGSDKLPLFSFGEGGNGHDFRFSCRVGGRAGDFRVDTETGIVSVVALSEQKG